MNKTTLSVFAALMICCACATTPTASKEAALYEVIVAPKEPKKIITQTCLNNPELQKKRSAELTEVLNENMADRAPSKIPPDWKKISENDLRHRKIVAEIFAESCIRSLEDHKVAAIIFAHGDSYEHYLFSYQMAKRAIPADPNLMRWYVASAIDSYMTTSGFKSLFGLANSLAGNGDCTCLRPVEPTFPDDIRVQYTGLTLKQTIYKFEKGRAYHCRKIPVFCAQTLKTSTKGQFPEIW